MTSRVSLVSLSTLRSRSVVLLDLLLAAWVVAWILMGIWVAREVRGLSALSDTLAQSAAAVEETGRALEPLEDLPFVGEEVARLADRARLAAASARASARSSRDRAGRLATLLGVSIAVAPSAPILALYVPLRARRLQESARVRRSLRSQRRRADPALPEFLARRAAERLPFHRLRAITSNPWRDLERGQYEALAEAELRRLGLGRRWSRRHDQAPPPEPPG
jgi:hypothetical protein